MSAEKTSAADDRIFERYARAKKFYKASIGAEPVVLNSSVLPAWIGETNRFWYERQTPTGKQFRCVDAVAGVNEPAFDHDAVAEALASASGERARSENLPIRDLSFSDDLGSVFFSAFDRRWRYQGRRCREVAALRAGVRSPDGSKELFCQDNNLWVRDLKTGDERALTQDGEERNAYAALCTGWGGPNGAPHMCGPQARWSPDGRKLLTIQRDSRGVRDLPIMNYVPSGDVTRPTVDFVPIAYPGDEALETSRLLCIDIATGRHQAADYRQLPATRNGYGFFDASLGWWNNDGRIAYFIDVDHGYKYARVIEFDTQTGVCRELFEETSDTHVNLMLNQDDPPDILPIIENNELIWFSERTGYGHFYLYDLTSGDLIRPLTSGDWIARKIVRYIPERREVFVQTAGREAGIDPYYRNLVRIDLESGNMATVVEGDFDHITIPRVVDAHGMFVSGLRRIASASGWPYCGVAPSGDFAVVTRSRADSAPTTYLLDRNGKEITVVEQADLSGLPDGWQWPEPVELVAADGATPIYGVVFRPSDFDPDVAYPVISHGFNQPEIAIVPKGSFSNENSGGAAYHDAAALAELGFVVVMIDGRGSPMRDKAFYDHCYGRFERASDIDDHVAGIRQLAERHSSFDLDRVGVYAAFSGGSGAVQGLLRHPDFFKVGTTTALHDRRFMPAQMQANKYEGVHVPQGERHHMEDFADQLRGKLLIAIGLLDRSTAPAATFRLVEAFQKANKTFDMIALPNMGHDLSPYLTRRSWDYLVQHLARQTPPRDFDLLSDEDV